MTATLGEISQLITSLGVIGGLFISYRNGKKANAINQKADVLTNTAEFIAQKAQATVIKMEEIHASTNGMKDELVASTAKASLAEGRASGRKEGHAAGLEEARNGKHKK